MKVFYWGSFYFTDTDFCIVKHLQDKGVDVTYFIPLEKGRTRGALLDIRKQYNKTGIFEMKRGNRYESSIIRKRRIDA